MNSRTTNCAFCKAYKNAHALADYATATGSKAYLQVKLFEYVAKRGGKEFRSKTHRPMKLRFCPSCGVKLTRN